MTKKNDPNMVYLISFLVMLSLAFAVVMRRSLFKALQKPERIDFLRGHIFRDCDTFGCGHFGAPRKRNGVRYTHKGLDVVYMPSDSVKMPFDGFINRIGRPYANDEGYKLIEVIGTGLFKGYKAKLMYATTHLLPDPNKVIKQDTVIGKAQNISAKYGPGMVNHVHYELYDENGSLVNPEGYA